MSVQLESKSGIDGKSEVHSNGQFGGPKGWDAVRCLQRMRGPGILDAVMDLWRGYGDRVRLPLPFGRSLYLINDPTDVLTILQRKAKKFVKGRTLDTFKLLIGDGVATSEQKAWIRHRRTAQPNFQRPSLETYAATVVHAAGDHRRRWECGRAGEYRDFYPALLSLSQDVVGRTLLGADLSPQLDQIQDAWLSAMAFVLHRTTALLRLPLGLPLPSHRRFLREAGVIRRCVEGLIDRRAASEANAAAATAEPTFLGRVLGGECERQSSRSEIASQILNILFAGHETTASGLASALFLILSHPEVEAAIRAELDAVLGGAPPSYGALTRQVYLRRVVYEALRLYPPVALFVREALEDVELPGGTLPKGASVVLSPFVLHRHPRLWSDAESFRPERFASAALMQPPFFFAFGAGGRACVGDDFAVNAMMLILGDLLQHCALELDPAREIGFAFGGTLHPEPLRIKLGERRAAPIADMA